jgi:hypothetical protein
MPPRTIQRTASLHAAVPVTQHLALNCHLSPTLPKRSEALRRPGLSLVLSMGLILLTGLTGCGPVSSDNAPSLGPRAAVVEPPPARPAQEDRQLSKPAGTTPIVTPDSKTDGPERLPAPLTPEIPDSVTKDLDSPYASIRLSALDHWAGNELTTPLDPVFEALQDQDEAVQAKALEIIERRLAVNQTQARN